MKYLSVCSGIEAATVAWTPLGWKAYAFAEIEKFPCAVLAYHYPHVQNLGDILQFRKWPDANFDVLVGGTPCQSFSVAGFRKGLSDPRGNLMLTYLAIAARYRPDWLVWENVPGCLSTNEGRDFGAFIWALGKLGYGWAYRSLDAQYFNLAQQRQRVFVVASARGWASAAAVLFERACLSGNPAPSRQAGQDITGTLSARTEGGGGLGTDFDIGGGLQASSGGADENDAEQGRLIGYSATGDACWRDGIGPLSASDDNGSNHIIAHCLRADGFDASEDGTGRGVPLIAASLSAGSGNAKPAGRRREDDVNLVAFAQNQREEVRELSLAGSLASIRRGDAKNETLLALPLTTRVDRGGSHREAQGNNLIPHNGVRRLTPRECERLQGFPDDYSLVEYRGKPAKDGPRYKALGNSMATPVMRWIGERIQAVDDIQNKRSAVA